MRLRPRLALVTVAASVPTVLGLVWWDARSQQRASAAELLELTRALADTAEWRAGCEQRPETWRGRPDERRPGPPRGDFDEEDGPRGPGGPAPGRGGPPPRFGAGPPDGAARAHRRPASFFAYRADLTSPNLEAPRLAPALLRAIGDRDALTLSPPWPGSLVHVLVRMPFRGPAGMPARGPGAQQCAFVLAEGTTERWLGGVLPPTHLWLLPLVAVFGAVLLAAGPLVRRLGQLTAAAHRSEESGYQRGVTIGGDDEISELARSLDEAAAKVRAQLAETRRRELALREFVANTTHDIMIPLTVLQGHLAEQGSASGGEALAAAMQEAHYLGALIHNLAMAAKLDAAEREPVQGIIELGALVERVVLRHRAIARGAEVALDRAVPAEPVTIQGDVTMVEQAVTNLVYNAVRYNRSGGHIAVVLERRDGDRFSLAVIDDGPGIPAAELPRLLTRGSRGNEARARAPQGRGLGLDITHRVAALHQLEVKFAPSEHGGLAVELTGRCQAAPLRA